MIKYKNKEINTGFIRVKCISENTYDLLKSMDKQVLSIDNIIKYAEYGKCNSSTINDIHSLIDNIMDNTMISLLNISYIKIMYDIINIKSIKFDTFYIFRCLITDEQKTVCFLTNDKTFIEKYIK